MDQEQKKQIRARHIKRRNELSEQNAAELSLDICRNLLSLFSGQEEWKRRGVYGYYPHGREASALELYRFLLAREIPLAFPRVSGSDMDFYRVSSMEELKEGSFRIMEPIQECPLVFWEHAACLTPGSVFDREGNRYGYGKGYYDRYFAVHGELYRIGIAYESQVEEQIPTETTDIKMHALATEQGILCF